LQGLVEEYIRDEIFYREGRAAGLDRDDTVIRRRVRQKMELLANDMTAARQWLDMIASDGETPSAMRSRTEALQALLPPVAKS